MYKENWLQRSVQKGLKLHEWYFDPVFLNTQHIRADKPALYIGNHTLYGVTDAPLLWQYLRQEHSIFIRALGDRIHFQIPIWRDILKQHGVLEGTPENCRDLMQQGESVLVFPGGAREVFKHKHEEYQLIWKQRTGFARMAIEQGYDIVPFAAIGGDDCYDIVVDSEDIINSPKTKWLLDKLKLTAKLRGGEMIPPYAVGLAKLPIPRPERMYFSFGERISTENSNLDQTSQWQIRQQVEQSIEQQLAQLMQYREKDRQENWGWLRKKLT